MQLAYEGLQIAKTLVGHSNPNCASDLGVGILQLRACVYGAWLNVKINLPGVKDEAFAAKCEEEGKAMLEKGEAIAARIYGEIEASL
jgi:formiminotetrahydrofolate cyclodeaminase